MDKQPGTEVYYYNQAEFQSERGWYWIDYKNRRLKLKYEGGPFATEAEAQASLQEYLKPAPYSQARPSRMAARRNYAGDGRMKQAYGSPWDHITALSLMRVPQISSRYIHRRS